MRTVDPLLRTADEAPMNVGQLMGTKSTELKAGIRLQGASVAAHRDVIEGERQRLLRRRMDD
jgi:hypothetical protein